jgi:hypothetical protein
MVFLDLDDCFGSLSFHPLIKVLIGSKVPVAAVSETQDDFRFVPN